MAAGAVLVIALAALVGAFIQSVVGLGVGLLVAPAVAGLAPDLMPVLPLLVALTTAALAVGGEWHEVSWPVIGWSLPARVPGTAVGVWLVVVLTAREIGIAVGLMVLVAVLLSLRSVVVPVNRGTLLGAGFVSGVTGTATSIGGPPLAILVQHRPPPEARSTLSVFFLVGIVLSLGGMALAGAFSREAVLLSLVLAPGVVLGAWAGWRVRDRVPRDRFRTAVLGVCAASALLLLVRSVV